MNENPLPQLAVIFDMDGVLVDSVSLNWQAMNSVLEQYGVNVPNEDVKKYLGRTLADQVSQFNQDFSLNLNYEEFNAATQTIKTKLFAELGPKSGVESILTALKERKIPIAVATSMPRELTEQRLRTTGLLDYFDVLVTEDDVQNHKPDPEVFMKAAEMLGIASSSCIVFEDAPAGVEAAKKAGMACIAVETPYVTQKDLSRADLHVPNLSSLTISQLERLIET